MKKSIKLHKMTRYLVENCGLFSWLSSVLSNSRMHLREEKCFFLMQMVVVLEVNTQIDIILFFLYNCSSCLHFFSFVNSFALQNFLCIFLISNEIYQDIFIADIHNILYIILIVNYNLHQSMYARDPILNKEKKRNSNSTEL